MRRVTYIIEGNPYQWHEVRAKVPAYVKECTLRQRLWWYRYNTWVMLCAKPYRKRRTRQRIVIKTEPAKIYRPAFAGEW